MDTHCEARLDKVVAVFSLTFLLALWQIYDNAGETTTLAAAEIVHSLIQLMADRPVKPTSSPREGE